MVMKQIRRFLVFTLILSLVMSNFVFADNKVVIDVPDKELPIGIDIKISENLKSLELGEDDQVRIIIELNEEPVIKHATRLGLQVVQMDEAQVDSIVDSIEVERAETLDALSNLSIDTNVINTYENIFNGMAMEVQYGDIEKIAAIDNVKHVSISKEYTLPEPQMINSSKYTKASEVNEDYGYKGEGIIVSIIDSGVDYTHKDMKVDDGTAVALNENEVIGIITSNNLPGHFFTEKVVYGYNYIDRTDDIIDLQPDTGMHGMHVAGTVAANGEIKGVAPNAQLLAMKVFSNDPGIATTYGDILVAAMEDSITMGADVMNLSIGATAQWVDPADPEQVAVRLATENGIVMSISAGNSAYFGNGFDEPFPYASNPDIGVVGSPGLSIESIQVASMDNYTELYTTAVEVEGMETILGYGADNWKPGTYELVTLGNKLGYAEDYDGVDVSGKVVLVSRGVFSFFDKIENAEAAGAVGIIVYDHELSGFYYNQGGFGQGIPFMLAHKTEGLALEALTANGGIEIEVSLEEAYANPTSGKISSFSSWGSTPNLDFKPELTAPGGNIYSTLNDDEYGSMSGTSMAAPHVAGGAALIAQRLREDSIFPSFAQTKDGLTEKSLLIKNILMNTATPIRDTDTYVYGGTSYSSVRQQGAGAMNLLNACKTTVVITEENTNVAKVTVGEVSDKIDFTLRAKNYGDADVKYNVSAMAQMNSTIQGYNLLGTEELDGYVTTISVAGTPIDGLVTVPAGGEVLVRFEMDLTDVTMLDGDDILTVFENGNYIEGFAFFELHEENLSSAKMTADTLVSDLTSDLAALTTELETLEADAKDNADAVEAVQAAILKAETDLETLKTSNADTITLAESYATAESAYLSAQEAYDVLVAANVDLTTDSLAQLGTDKMTLQTELETLEGELTPLEAELVTLTATKTTADETLAATVTALEEADAALLTAQNADPVVEQDVTDAQAEVDAQTAQKSTDETAVTAAADAVSAQQILVDAKADEITAKEEAIATLTTSIEEGNAILVSIETAAAAVTAAEAAKDAAELTLTEDVKAAYATYTTQRDQLLAEKAAHTAALVALENNKEAADEAVAAQQALVDLKQAALESANDVYDLAEDAYYNELPISVPFLGFYGDFGDAPGIDAPLYDADSFYAMTGLVDENGSFLGQQSKEMKAEWVSISPNNDGVNDIAVPVVSFLRNMKDISYTVVTEDDVVVRTLGINDVQSKDYYDGKSGREYSYLTSAAFDGMSNLKVLPDGQYYVRISGKLDDKDKTVTSLDLPIKIDTVAPVITRVAHDSKAKTITVDVTELGSGADLYELYNENDELIAQSETNVIDVSEVAAGTKVTVSVIDFAGNDVLGDMFIINDNKTPDVTLSTEPLIVYNSNELTFTGTVTDMTEPTLTINGAEVSIVDGAFTYDHIYSADGLQSLLVVATDELDNEITFTRDFYIDSKPATIEVTPTGFASTEATEYVANDVETVSFTALVKDVEYPVLTVKYNGDVVYSEYPDFMSYQEYMADAEFTFTKEVTLVEGDNRILITAEDAGGNVTTFDKVIYKLAADEVEPSDLTITTSQLTTPDTDVSFERPVEFEFASSDSADWSIEVIDPNGNAVEIKTATDSDTVTGEWAPEEAKKLNGTFKLRATATNGGTVVTVEEEFTVHNYQVKIIDIQNIEQDGMLFVEATVKNLGPNATDSIVVVQLRQADGTVFSISTTSVSLTGTNESVVRAGVLLPADGSYKAQVFVWDEWTTPTTMGEKDEYTFELN